MVETTCFTRDELRGYLLGELAEEVSVAVATHVEECDECEATVARLDRESDTLIESLREPVVQETPASVYRLAAKRARSYWSDRQTDSTSIGDPSTDVLRLRDYELIEPMARGGMGTVYKARHVRLNRQVAVKVLPSRWLRDPGVVARFQREMQAVGSLRHSAIVQATDGGEVDGVHYLVMELIDGLDGGALVRYMGPLSVADACSIVRQAALGMAYVHERGIVHRDLKPSNLMVTSSGEVKVLDLGLARVIGERLAEDELTTVGQLMGTLDYMAPEQLENSHDVDEHADIYALGATLYKLLAGQPPHSVEPREPIVSKLRRISADPPVPLQKACPKAPEGLCSLVDTMLAREASDRPATMQVVADSLDVFCGGSDLAIRVDEARQNEMQAGFKQENLLASQSEDLAKLQGRAVEPQPADEGRRGGGWFKWVAASFLFLAIAYGVVVTLETTAGRLVIETATPDVEVRVLKAGKPYKELTLKHKAKSLRLGAGQYEIEIISDAEGLEIQNGTYTLRRGETWVAKIVHRQGPGHVAARVPLPDAVDSDVPMYEGKNLDQWLALLERERSATQLYEASQAFQKLAGKDRQEEVATALLKAARHHSMRSTTIVARGRPASLYEPVLMTLKGFEQDPVVDAMTAELADGEDLCTEWILFYFRRGYFGMSSGKSESRKLTSEPLLTQIDLLAANQKSRYREEALEVLASVAPDQVAGRRFIVTLSDDDISLRLYAAEQLIRMKSNIPLVVSSLRQILPEGELGYRAQAAWLLGDLGPEARPALPELIALAEDAGEKISMEEAFHRQGESHIIRPSVKDAAIRALAEIGDQKVVPLLVAEWMRRGSPDEKLVSSASWDEVDRLRKANTYTMTWVGDAIEKLIDVRPSFVRQTDSGGPEIIWKYQRWDTTEIYGRVFGSVTDLPWDEMQEGASRLADHTGELQKQEIWHYVRNAGTPPPSARKVEMQIELIKLLARHEGVEWILEPVLKRWSIYASDSWKGWKPGVRESTLKTYQEVTVRIIRECDDWPTDVVPQLLKLAEEGIWTAGVVLLELLPELDEKQQVRAVCDVFFLANLRGESHLARYRQQLATWLKVPEQRAALAQQMDEFQLDSWRLRAHGMFRLGVDDEVLKEELKKRFSDVDQSVRMNILSNDLIEILGDKPEFAQTIIELLDDPALDVLLQTTSGEPKLTLRADLISRQYFIKLDPRHQDNFVPWLRKLISQGRVGERGLAEAILKSWGKTVDRE